MLATLVQPQVFGSILKHEERNRTAYFVRLTIDVDRYSRLLLKFLIVWGRNALRPGSEVVFEQKQFFMKVYFHL